MAAMKPTKDHPYPRVGVGVLIIKDGRLLFGLRHGSHGADTWAPPGGKLELGETWAQCAERETLEEAGVKIKNVHLLTVTEEIHLTDNLHYATVHMISDWASGQPKIMEPAKCKEWGWFNYDNLPLPLFASIQNLKTQYPNALPC